MRRYGPLMIVIALVAAACSAASSDEPTTTTRAPTTTQAPTTTEAPTTTTEPPSTEDLALSSPLFEHEGEIPVVITCDGEDISPQLDIGGLPEATVSMVLLLEDPDAPGGTWDHWVTFNIAPTDVIPEDVGDLGTPGLNSWGDPKYGGPCPPPGSGPHRYVFTLYALDSNLDLETGVTKGAVLDALSGRVLAETQLMGTYER